MHDEIERKYLIEMPDTAALSAFPGVEIWEIEQTYLCARPGVSARVRRVATGGTVNYIYTEKRRKSTLTAEESEWEISAAAYEELLQNRDPERATVKKTRYRLPYAGHTVEVDVYAFWADRATAEVELSSEGEAATLPPFLQVRREVSADGRYKNRALAKSLVSGEWPQEGEKGV